MGCIEGGSEVGLHTGGEVEWDTGDERVDVQIGAEMGNQTEGVFVVVEVVYIGVGAVGRGGTEVGVGGGTEGLEVQVYFGDGQCFGAEQGMVWVEVVRVQGYLAGVQEYFWGWPGAPCTLHPAPLTT